MHVDVQLLLPPPESLDPIIGRIALTCFVLSVLVACVKRLIGAKS